MPALLTETTSNLTSRLDEELRLNRGEKLSRQVLCNLVKSADILAGLALSAWAWVRETLEREGFEGRELAATCKVLVDGIDGGIEAHKQLLALAKSSGHSPETVGLKDLEAKLPALQAARPKVVEVHDLATRGNRPDDLTLLAETSAAMEKGQFVTMDDEYLNRVRANGNI